jgi:predicted metalloprotease with PDZ domain
MCQRQQRGVARSRLSFALLALFGNWATVHAISTAARAAPALEIEVDARDLPRRLLHTRIHVPCQPGTLRLWFPKWVPGTHGPYGPVQNVAGLRIEAPAGKNLSWQRDEVEPYRFECQVPDGVHEILVRLDTICNEPAILAAGFLSYGNASVGIINWGTCLLYPESFPCDDISAHLTVRLPKAWRFATSLKADKVADREVSFQTVSLTDLVDSPLIAGALLRSIPLNTGVYPPAFLDLASESPSALQLSPKVVDLYSRVVREAGTLFGTCHYSEFHFLVTCSDEFGYLGLEHLTSSINGVRAHDLIDDARRKGWVANLLPHEYVHSWCGKYRRPAGMCTADFHTPQKTRLLWVYEGLTEYLGEVLMVRSGLLSPEEYRESLAATIREQSRHVGRRWRPLEDTAVASHMLRQASSNWNDLRRSQDYYFEGMLIWLEVDAIIRERSGNKKCLDDFCRRFFGAGSGAGKVVAYDLSEIVSILRGLAEFDWETFLTSRVARPLDALPLDVVDRCGYRLEYTARPSAGGIHRPGAGEDAAAAQDSIGLSFGGDGSITEVVPGMIGDQARIAPGMKVIGINGKTFSRQRVLDALDESVKRGTIELLLVEGEDIRTVVLKYAGGPRHLRLARNRSKPDLLAEILKPRESSPHTPALPPPAQGTSSLPAPREYICYRATGPIRIDGRLDDAAWQAASWTSAFVDIEGDVRPRPRFRTRAKMLWDDTYFYAGALLDEPHVWGSLTEHDSVIFRDNDFEIFIDPDGDNHEYYEIEVNALNTVWDLFLKKPYRDDGRAFSQWEIPGLKTAVHVMGTLNDPKDTDASWSVECAIPWSALREFAHRAAPPKDGDQWRVNFSRVEWQHEIKGGHYRKIPRIREDNWVWSPQGAIDMHRPERWGYVQFSTAPPGHGVFKPDPTGPIRAGLMQIYYSQKEFFKANKHWAATLGELKVSELSGQFKHTASLRLLGDGYEAAITFVRPDGRSETWTIHEDGRIQGRAATEPGSKS